MARVTREKLVEIAENVFTSYELPGSPRIESRDRRMIEAIVDAVLEELNITLVPKIKREAT